MEITNKEERYEINSKGELVVGVPKVVTDRKKMIESLFSRFGWKYELISEIAQSHYNIKVSNENLGKSYNFHLYHGNVRKEDPDRNRAEKKIQLGGLDPREIKDGICLILGFYIYENDNIDDSIIVAWPIEQNKNYPNNPSLRVNMKQDILPAKNNGIHFDLTTGKQIVTFKPDFIYYYLENYQNLHGYGLPQVEPLEEITNYTTEWFVKEAEALGTIDDEAEELYKEFRELFAPQILKGLNGVDILHRIFINETGIKNSLCHYLEYDKRYNIFGSVAGGSAYKYGLFYSHKEQSWMTGSGQKKIKLSEPAAIELGTKIRNQLVAGAEIISEYGELNNIKDYAELQAKLYAVMDNTIGKAWVMMYYHMIFPGLFPVFYNEEWQRKVLEKISIDADENSFIRMGQIALFVKHCGISNVAFSKVINKIEVPKNQVFNDELCSEFAYNVIKGGAQNKVIYGTPGCGKSWHVQNRYLKDLDIEEQNRVRTTFYQDYTNTDFVGQILPKVHEDKTVTYEFNPGPFAIALRTAIEKPDKNVALIIEELNRGNAASIFGDIFQLLDRDKDGCSQYCITNTNLQDYLNTYFVNEKFVFNNIRIPANLYIVATMNTSDQNVFTLDTAFKRRWEFEKIQNKFTDKHAYKDYYIPGMPGITWAKLVNSINRFIVNQSDDLNAEDKQLGVYFIAKEFLCEKEEDIWDDKKRKAFAYKLFEYLWDDVAKFSHAEWFGNEIKTLDELIDSFLNDKKQVLENVLN